MNYLTCPNCEGESFKEYTLDLVVNKNVRVFQDGKVDYTDVEVDGYVTAESAVLPERKVLFYVCEDCGEMFTFYPEAKGWLSKPATKDKEAFLKIRKAVG